MPKNNMLIIEEKNEMLVDTLIENNKDSRAKRTLTTSFPGRSSHLSHFNITPKIMLNDSDVAARFLESPVVFQFEDIDQWLQRLK